MHETSVTDEVDAKVQTGQNLEDHASANAGAMMRCD